MKDNNLEAFHNTWNRVLSELATKPSPELLQYWYFKQIKDFKPLSEDIAHYRRSEYHKSPDYSFEWLYSAACRYLAQKRSDYMQDSLNRSLNAAPNKALPGVKGPKDKGKGGNGDKKGGKKDRSQTPGPKEGKGGRDSPKGGAVNKPPNAGGGRGKDLDPGICFAFQRGACTRGAACGYAHKMERGRSPSPKAGGKSQKQCTFYAAGTCKFGADCRDKHGGRGGGGGNSSPSPGNKKEGKGTWKGTWGPEARCRGSRCLYLEDPCAQRCAW